MFGGKKQRESAPADASEREDLRLILLKLYLVNLGKKTQGNSDRT